MSAAAAETLDAASLAARLRALAPDGALPDALALAVSGGGDSMALLALAAELGAEAAARGGRLRLVAFTVDHQLREESAAEAAAVGRAAAALGVAHEILVWRRAEPTPAANIQAEARTARYRLMAERRRALGIGPLLVAHTADDAAETFLIRLGRGSGVDGLALMPARRVEDAAATPPLEIWRPFLDLDGATLREACRARRLEWIEDPSNGDARFARVRARAALAALEPLGLTRARLLKTAQTMARARAALSDAASALWAAAAVRVPSCGAVRFEAARLAEAPREIALRAFAAALGEVGSAAYPPRLDALEAAFDAMTTRADAPSRTLLGCVLARDASGRLWVGREAAAAKRVCAPGERPAAFSWDGRFQVEIAAFASAGTIEIGALGAEAPAVEASEPDADAPPRIVRAGAPGVWVDGVRVGAPTLGAAVSGVRIASLAPFCG